jgi:hypothetical protein
MSIGPFTTSDQIREAIDAVREIAGTTRPA